MPISFGRVPSLRRWQSEEVVTGTQVSVEPSGVERVLAVTWGLCQSKVNPFYYRVTRCSLRETVSSTAPECRRRRRAYISVWKYRREHGPEHEACPLSSQS